MLTTEQLHAIMPQLPAAKGATFFPFLTAAAAEFGIDRPARTAAFLAQLAHESAQLRFMEEIWGPTAAQKRYEPASQLAARLGNTEVGDGKRFKGRGPIQLTGRANYRRFGDLLGVDLVADPDRGAMPEVAFRIAGLFWSKRGLNELADQGTSEAFREITRRINGGFNGLAERERFYEVAKTVLGVAGPSQTRGGTRSPIAVEEEPGFERGHEAVRADTDRTRTRRRKRGAKTTTARKRTAARKRSVERGGARKAKVGKGARRTQVRPTGRKRTSKGGGGRRRSPRTLRARTTRRRRRPNE